MTAVAFILIALPVAVALYAYAGYPILLALMGGRAAPLRRSLPDPAPMVTMVVPAYNEQRQIAGAIESLLAQDYPADRRQILIVSDASSDATDDIVRGFASRGVELMRTGGRLGKTAAENEAVSQIRGDIVINSDASVRMAPSTVRLLVAAMSDPGIGVASTRDVSQSRTEATGPSAEAGYVGYEMRIRQLETNAGGIVGASGSGYAIRADLHRHPVRPDLSRDFSAALTARRHGFSAVSVEDAVCHVPRTHSLAREYRRKVRTIARGMDTLYFNRDLLDPIRHGAFAWKLLSHKLARWLVPVTALPALVGLALLARHHAWSGWLLGLAALLAGAALLASRWPESRRLPGSLAGILGALSANLAVVHAAWRFFVGHEDHVWEPTRR